MASNLKKLTLNYNRNYKASGPKSYVYLLNKYKFSPTKDGPYFVSNKAHTQGKHGEDKSIGGKTIMQKVLQKRVADNQSGDVPADDQQNDSLYLCPVTIGTPGQTFNLDFDTGSADLWLWSTELPKETIAQYKNEHNIYDASKSSSFNKIKATWKISYGDGSTASGDVGTDDVDIGGLVIKDQAIELAKQLSAQFASGPGDGLLGLAFGKINTVDPGPVKTPVENMIAQTDIPKTSELFTAHLSNYKNKSDAPFYTFGYIDQASLEGQEPYYTPIDSSAGFWTFESASAVVAGNTIERSGNTAIADTGTTLALVDDAVCQAIYDAIPGATYDSSQQGYIFPSSVTTDQLPDVSFAVGGKQFSVQKEDLAFADAGKDTVYGGVQSRGDLKFDILGDTFLKGIYAIFDQGNTRFGAVQRTAPTS